MASSRREFLMLPLGLGVVAATHARPITPLAPAAHVSGRIAGGERLLTVEMLEKMPQRSFSTNAPWTKAPQVYSGPLLRDVLKFLGATGSQLEVTALNEYSVSVPVEDARLFDMIVAHRIGGQPMPVRDRGPMMFMYPFDSQRALQAQRYYERAIWQIKSIVVE